MLFEILIIFLLILLNGFFSMAEVAIVASRKARLVKAHEDGDKRAEDAMKLKKNRDQFLSTVQVGITLIGILAGVVSGATLADRLTDLFDSISWTAAYAASLAMALVVMVITYLTLVFGELIPKKIGLNNPEQVAGRVARPMLFLQKLAKPIIRILTTSSSVFVKLLGIKEKAETPVSEDEIKYLVEQGAKVGVFAEQEHDMVDSVFRLGDKMVSSLMTPRSEVDWLNIREPFTKIRERVVASDRSRFPLCERNMDHVIGVVRAQDVLALEKATESEQLKAIMHKVPFVPENKPALDVLKLIKASGSHFIVIVDEYGEVIGIVTLTDILEAIVGEVPALEDSEDELQAVEREDGSWLIDGMMSIDDFEDLFEVKEPLDDDNSAYQTLGGMVMAHTGDIPSVGDVLEIGDFSIEVIDMDSMRVDKVLVKRMPSVPQAATAEH